MANAEDKKAIREALKRKQRSEALRANLKRRKEQANSRKEEPAEPVQAKPEDRFN